MLRFRTASILTLIVMVWASACAPQSQPVFSEETSEPAIADETAQKDFENFNPDNFDNPTNIDNKWFPLKPGMQYVYEGITNDD
jgi:hypothetical protein